MKIFVSHIEEERGIALAFKTLIEKLNDNIEVWFSSDMKPTGGMGIGDWREKIITEIDEASLIVAIVTPASNGRTWVAWESGYAQASKKKLVPLAFFMEVEAIHPVYGNIMAYIGDGEKGKGQTISRLCAMLINMCDGQVVNDEMINTWKLDIEKYLKQVQEEKSNLADQNLFVNKFHSPKIVEELVGKTWHAKWGYEKDDGLIETFEVDTLTCYSTATRFRMIGNAVKGGSYPMEGVVSNKGHIALTYWSEGKTPICGTTLMEKYDLTGEILIGTWSGFTELSLKAKEAHYYRGPVVMALSRETVENWEFD